MRKVLKDVFEVSEDSREAYIHSFDRVGDVNQNTAFFCKLLNIVARGRVIRNMGDSSETVETIANCNIESLPENSISMRGVCNDLSVAPADIEDCGMIDACC
jgi:hypothetical protein